MTTLREAAQQALEQLKINRTNFRKGPSKSICKMLAGGNDEAIADLESALAEPVQEPFGYLWPTGRHPEFRFTQQKRDGVDGTPLYTAPHQRTAEPVQEPVAWVECDGDLVWNNREAAIGRNLYTSPPPQQTEPSQDTPPQHEYEVTANDDGTFSVGLPDGEELRIIPPQRPAEPVQEPVAWRPALKSVDPIYRSRTWNDGTPSAEDVDYWTRNGQGIEYAYTAPPQRKPVEWDGRCMLGHCNSPAGCENSGECRAIERAHGIT